MSPSVRGRLGLWESTGSNCFALAALNPLQLPAPRLLTRSDEDGSSTGGSHPGSLHYLWPVVKHASSLPPHSRANYQHYHLLFERDAAQIEKTRAVREAGKRSQWRKGGLE